MNLNELNPPRDARVLHAHTESHTARCIAELSLADNTRIAYQKGWRRFVDFCAARGCAPLPAAPATVVEFVIAQASPAGKRLSYSTVALTCNAINRKHAEAGLARPGRDPQVADALRALRRLNGAGPRRVMALREHHIQAMVQVCAASPSLLGLRDAALLALGFAAALRRSEICNLIIDDMQRVDAPLDASRGRDNSRAQTAGMFLRIRRSKTDPEAMGQTVAIPEGRVIRPLHLVDEWLHAAGLRASPGAPLFQSMRRGGKLTGRPLHPTDVPRIVKHYAARIGLDPRDIAGHSLRAGFVTSAAWHNARLDKIMAITRHRQVATVLNYIRDADAFCHHAGADFL